MSNIIQPIINENLNSESIEYVFSFPIPLQQELYHWEPNVIGEGTNAIIDNTVPIFPGEIDGTNFLSQVYKDEFLLFKTDTKISAKKWSSFKEEIIGDTDLLSFNRQFRYSYELNDWSDWLDLTLENLNKTEGYPAYYEFKYVALTDVLESEFIPIYKPNTIGWFQLTSDGTNFFQFDNPITYPNQISFKIGDITLNPNHAIAFGKNLATAKYNTIDIGDYIFINPLYQGIILTGNEELEIVYTPRESVVKPSLLLQSLTLNGENVYDTTNTIFDLTYIGEKKILQPDFIYKVFKFESFELSLEGETENRTMDIYFRYSQDKKKWSQWEILNNDNFSTIKPSSLSFFYLEVAFIRNGTDTTGKIGLRDLVINGDFQNVSANYLRMNRFGFRCDCDYSNTTDGNANGNSNCFQAIVDEWANSCTPKFQPYNFNQPVQLYNKLANDATQIFGWDVTYYRISPDGKGRDMFLHEYQLFNVVDKKDIKITVPDNKFPENTVPFNNFDLALFESFEIHITKDIFHNAFGIEHRPAKKDFLFFCQMNRMYKIEHSQPYKDILNSSVFYKVILTKYQNDVSIDNRSYTSALQELIQNNSTENLLQPEVYEEVDKKVNKMTLQDLTESSNVKLSIKAPISDFELLNGPNIIAKNYYNLTLLANSSALIYKTLDTSISKGDNRCITAWFNINEYVVGQDYNFIKNKNNKGYKIGFKDGNLIVELNEQIFTISVSLNINIWYGVVININQRQQLLEWAVYQRKTQPVINDTLLELVDEGTEIIEPVEWNDPYIVMEVLGSPLYFTNLRVYKTVIEKDKHSKALNQFIVKDTSNLILADNANRKVISPEHKM